MMIHAAPPFAEAAIAMEQTKQSGKARVTQKRNMKNSPNP
jgi:hypothetical protein